MPGMRREPMSMIATIGATADASTAIELADFASGSFHLPSTSGTTGVTVYSQLGSEPYAIAKDEDNGDLVLAVTAGQPRPLPFSVYNYQRIKLVASGGTATVNVPVFLKS